MSFYQPLVTAMVTFLLTCLLLSNKAAHKLQDMPNERSLHLMPVPRIGGIGLITGVLCGWALMSNSLVWWVVVPLIVLFTLSLLDDLYNLPVKLRLSVHLIAASLMVWGMDLFAQQGVAIALAILLFTVWMINLYNFMDGSDGLAGGMAMFGFGMYGIAALLAKNTPLSLLNFCITAAAASFLFFNFHRAKIFMGDSGSIPLGFLAAVMGVWGWLQGNWAAWFPILVFSPFIVDASITLARRTLRGDKITEAHREHYYQRLIQLGWSHRSVAILEYILMLSAGVSALCVINNPFPWLLFAAWGMVYAIMMTILDMRWNSFKRGESV